MKLLQNDQSLEQIVGLNLIWRLDTSPDGKFVQILNAEDKLVAGVEKDTKVAYMLLTAPKLVDALSRCVIILSNPELYPQMGESTVNYAVSVLKQSIGDIH